MAAVELILVDQLNIPVAEPMVGELNIEAQAPPQLLAPSPPRLLAPAEVQKALFKEGLFMTLISIGGILNPPITAIVNKTHGLLSKTFHFIAFVSLAIGVFQILVSIILHRMPRLITVAKRLPEIGWVMVNITLGYGSSLVLMGSSSPWLALHVIFLSIRFI